MQGAKVLVETLKAYGVEVIFGVPGDTSIPLYEALHDAMPSIRHVMARDERSAAFMADAYARIAHKPGICECPSGAGPLYAIPGVAEAEASSIPVILITSDISLPGEGKKTITELNCEKLFEPVTKWYSQLKDVARIPETIRQAFRMATTGRPGAVQLAIPQEVFTGEYRKAEEDIYCEPECQQYPAYRTRGSRAILEQFTACLCAAQRPAIIAGGGAKHSQASEQVQQLAGQLCAPVVTTIFGQGIMPDEHTLALGVIGDNGFHPHAHRAVEEADVLLYVGCKMGSVSAINWTLPCPKSDRKILQIDLDPELLGNNYKNHLSVVGDARLVLQDLLALLRIADVESNDRPWVSNLNDERRRFWLDCEPLLTAETLPIKPQRVVAALNRRITAPTIVIADAGTPTPHITRYLKLGGQGSTFIIPRAYGGLGYAIPALVGAHFANPEARLIGLFGDGSLSMSAGELETLARLRIPAVLIHFNNSCFGWIKALQALHCNEKFFSVDFTPGQPTLVAKGFGIDGVQVETPDELEAALDQAFEKEAPFFIDVLSECESSELPPVYSWIKAAHKKSKPIIHT